jgi:C4-dicarboxylate-specific signal transduction histidine kinase
MGRKSAMPHTSEQVGVRGSRLSRQLEALRHITEAVDSVDPDEVAERSLAALACLPTHQMSLLHLVAADGEHLHLRAHRGLGDAAVHAQRLLPLGQGFLGAVAVSGASRRVDDVGRSGELLPATQSSLADEGVRLLVAVPVRARHIVLGTLCLGRHAGKGFSDDESALLQEIADHVGLALDHARAHAEARRQLEELERAQGAVVRAERLSAVGELTRGVAHEINNPLTIIMGQVHIISQESTDEELQRGLEIIEKAARRAAGVIRDLRQFAEPASGQRRPCQLIDRVREVLALQDARLVADRVRCELATEDVPPVWADGNQIDQLLHHLITNARHAMATAHQCGTLGIRISSIHAGIRLEVADNGPGITADHLPRIFTPFFTTKGPDQGRGLGLSVAHGIVREHGGRLWAENRREGGALFVVELPLDLRGSERVPHPDASI